MKLLNYDSTTSLMSVNNASTNGVNKNIYNHININCRI